MEGSEGKPIGSGPQARVKSGQVIAPYLPSGARGTFRSFFLFNPSRAVCHTRFPEQQVAILPPARCMNYTHY